MVQRRIFRQRRPQLRSQEQLIQPQPSSFNPSHSQHVSQGSQNMLDNIDAELDHNATPAPNMDGLRPDLSGGIDNESARELKRRKIAQAETRAAREQTRRTPGSLAEQEAQPNLWNADSLYKMSAQNRKKGKGLLIGLGAGGGIVSVVAGFGFLLPFKLPGIMDTLMNDSGKRIERLVERRAERVIVSYFFQKDKIVTGNPIGDLFANIRTSNFETRIKDKYGLSLDRAENGALRLNHDGRDLGNFKNADELMELLNRDDLNTKELRRVFKLMARNDIASWRFFKKAKFIKFLRLKYNIPRLGTREQRTDETDEEYRRSIAEEHYENGQNQNLRNMDDFVNCMAESGDCSDLDRAGGASDLENRARQASTDIADTVADDIVRGAERTGIRLMSAKMTAIVGAASIPFFGEIDIAARLVHGLGKAINDDTLRVKHAQYISQSTAMLGSLYAGYADQTKWGGFDMAMAGMWADRFTGWETSKSYNAINNGTTDGIGLDPMERVGDAVTVTQFAENLKTLFNTVGWIGRGPFELWYYTVSQAIDFVGGYIGDAASFVAKHVPGFDAVMAQFTNVMGLVMEGLLKLVGMYIDPAAIGAKLALYVHEGLVTAYNDYAKDSGMRNLTLPQAQAQDAAIRADKLDDMAHMSFADRIFNISNPDSMVAALATNLPSGGNTNMVGAIATSTMRMVAAMPTNIARVTTGTAYAAGPGVVSETLFDKKIYGGTTADENAAIDANAYATEPMTCPENRDDAFNHCRFDRDLVESMSCSLVKKASCVDGPTGAGGGSSTIITGDTKFLAQQILDNKNITFEAQDNDQRGAKHDIELAAAGAQTKCESTDPVTLDPTLLQALLTAAKKYTFRINSLVSDHGCSKSRHPLGKAADLGMVNGNSLTDPDAMPPAMIPIYRQFAIDFSVGMTTGGHINQKNCIGVQKLSNNVQMTIDDACHHLHVDVP